MGGFDVEERPVGTRPPLLLALFNTFYKKNTEKGFLDHRYLFSHSLISSGTKWGDLGARGPPPPTPPPLGEPKFTVSAEHHLKEAYEQEIGLEMLEMAILKTQTLRIFWGNAEHAQDPLRKLVEPPFHIPRSAPASHNCVFRSSLSEISGSDPV